MQLLNIDGTNIADGGKHLTLGAVIATVLLPARADEKREAAEIAADVTAIAKLMNGGTQINLSAAKVADVQSRLATHFAPTIVAQAYRLLEGDAQIGVTSNAASEPSP